MSGLGEWKRADVGGKSGDRREGKMLLEWENFLKNVKKVVILKLDHKVTVNTNGVHRYMN